MTQIMKNNPPALEAEGVVDIWAHSAGWCWCVVVAWLWRGCDTAAVPNLNAKKPKKKPRVAFASERGWLCVVGCHGRGTHSL